MRSDRRVLLLGTSKHNRPTKRKVATFEKSLPPIFRSFCRPITLAYCVRVAQYVLATGRRGLRGMEFSRLR
jgi:hypothetical protein